MVVQRQQGLDYRRSSYQITYPDSSDKKDGSQSVCLESRYVIVKFAAGNLFAGRFGETIGTSGGTVYFGRPFTARPTALRLWCKYSGGTINRYQDNAPAEVAKVTMTRPPCESPSAPGITRLMAAMQIARFLSTLRTSPPSWISPQTLLPLPSAKR